MSHKRAAESVRPTGIITAVSAVISACGRYRYELRRGEGTPAVCWLMLNPSTADAETDDPTIRRVVGFTRSWGFAQAIVVNLFAWRATSPVELTYVSDPIGPDNDDHIEAAAAESALTILAYGVVPMKLRARLGAVSALLAAGETPQFCLGRTSMAGFPRHPLYVRGDTLPQPASTPGYTALDDLA